MCDIQSAYSNSDESGRMCARDRGMDEDDMCLSARIVSSDGLRFRFSRRKASIKSDIEEEFIKKGFEVNCNEEQCKKSVNIEVSNQNKGPQKENEVSNDKGEPIAPYLCEIIQKPTESPHISSNDPNPFQCPKCIKKFPRLQLLKQHQMAHSDHKPFACSECPRRFKKASHLKTHRLTHTEDSPYRCQKCDKKFTQDASLQAHLRKHAGIRPYLCKHCGKDFPKLFSLQRHELTHSEQYRRRRNRIVEKVCEKDEVIDVESYIIGKNVTPCETYDSEFGKKSSEGKEKNNDRKEVSKEFPTQVTQEKEPQHIAPYLCEVVEGHELPPPDPNDDKAFQCPKCYKRFSRLTYLKQHQMTHSDYKPFLCTECPMRFKKASHLKTHTLTHTDDSPYKCAECNKKFTQDASLKSHLLVHSGIKPYGCKDCGKRFTKLYTLQRHELTHTEERPFQCVLCFKKFSDVSNLRRHEMTHSNNKPYKCLLCNKNFSQLTHLKRHKVTHDIKGQEMVVVKIEPTELNN